MSIFPLAILNTRYSLTYFILTDSLELCLRNVVCFPGGVFLRLYARLFLFVFQSRYRFKIETSSALVVLYSVLLLSCFFLAIRPLAADCGSLSLRGPLPEGQLATK